MENIEFGEIEIPREDGLIEVFETVRFTAPFMPNHPMSYRRIRFRLSRYGFKYDRSRDLYRRRFAIIEPEPVAE